MTLRPRLAAGLPFRHNHYNHPVRHFNTHVIFANVGNSKKRDFFENWGTFNARPPS